MARLAHDVVRGDTGHPDPVREQPAGRHGVSHTVDASHQDSVAAVLEAPGGGAETVFHCSAVAQMRRPVLSAAASCATVVLTGSAPRRR